jgi:hypothetical protein
VSFVKVDMLSLAVLTVVGDFYPYFGRLLCSLSEIRYSISAHNAAERLSFLRKLPQGVN